MTRIGRIHGRRKHKRRPINWIRASLFFLAAIYITVLCLLAISYIWLPQFRTIYCRHGKHIRDPDIIAPKIFRSSEGLESNQVPDSNIIAAEIFWYAEGFERNYEEMERKLKVYVYSEDDEYPDFYFYPPRLLFGRYSSESFFFKNIKETRLRTLNFDEANLFFIPISCLKMVEKAFSVTRMTTTIQKYIQRLIFNYPFWNRTSGADHFFVACHEKCIRASKEVSLLMDNPIRVLCSPYEDAGYIPAKDVSLPQVMEPFHCEDGRNHDSENRTIFGIWGGPVNSYMRQKMKELLVLRMDPEVELEPIPDREKFARSKYCICHGITQIGTCIADSIFCGCVPVIFSSYSELPFNDVLDWTKFSLVMLNEHEVYFMKERLESLTDTQYFSLQEGTDKVQKHFQWNSPPKRYDAFHMVMYDIWLRVISKLGVARM